MKMIEQGDYFTINRPRQYGKTTTLFLLWWKLQRSEDYFPIFVSFEGLSDEQWKSESKFCPTLLNYLLENINVSNSEIADLFKEREKEVVDFSTLFKVLNDLIKKIGKKVVLFIDEVDRASNFELFTKFLGKLRDKYLQAKSGMVVTFQSVILAGVNDIKTLKQKIRPDSQSQFNSPWNIAADFKVEMSFSPPEIESMLLDYMSETGVQMDTKAISERLYFWTSGYPFLVSDICKTMAEDILPAQQKATWNVTDIDNVVKSYENKTNTLFDVLAKNLDSYRELYLLMEDIVFGSKDYTFDLKDPLINAAHMYGFISRNENGKVQVHNKIFGTAVTDFIISRNNIKRLVSSHYSPPPPNQFLKNDGRLDFEHILKRFQETMKERYSKTMLKKSDEFLEKDLRLLFVMFLQPILNCKGQSFSEVQIGGERRLDIVVTYADERFVVELKLWYGPAYHKKGLKQLKEYMQAMSIKKGYMLILDKSREKAFLRIKEKGIVEYFI